MNVKYIVETKYANGDSYADKLDTLEEVAEVCRYIESKVNKDHPDNQKLLATQFTVTTEEI